MWKRVAASALVVALAALTLAAGASAAFRSAGEDSGLLPSMARKGFVVEACGLVQLVAPAIRPDPGRARRARRVGVADERAAARLGRRARAEARASTSVRRGVRPGTSGVRRGAVAHRGPHRRATHRFRHPAGGRPVRERFSDAAAAALPKRQAGLLLGMTDGDTALLDDEIAEDFRTTGLAHIVAVSGYNVAVFLAIVMVLARAVAPRSRWLRVAVAVPSLLFFVFLTGLEPSVLRASVSAGVAPLGRRDADDGPMRCARWRSRSSSCCWRHRSCCSTSGSSCRSARRSGSSCARGRSRSVSLGC